LLDASYCALKKSAGRVAPAESLVAGVGYPDFCQVTLALIPVCEKFVNVSKIVNALQMP
jgi:hypothetical protein